MITFSENRMDSQKWEILGKHDIGRRKTKNTTQKTKKMSNQDTTKTGGEHRHPRGEQENQCSSRG
jgi:hypothetical protein